MRRFSEIFDIAADRHGGVDALEARLPKALPREEIAAIPDDRWLAQMTKCVFQSGFSWKVINAKWDGFEEAFHGFDIGRCLMMHDEDFERLLSDKRIIRNGQKIKTVQENAALIADLAKEHGAVGPFFADWPADRFCELSELLKKRGSRLGGLTGQRFLRFMGVPSFVLSPDVVARLKAEGVIDGPVTSKTAQQKIQDAFNIWATESGRGLTEISATLALSIDA